MTTTPSASRAVKKAALAAALPLVVDLLDKRRASQILESDIDDLVRIGWLEWQGGTLRATVEGSNICRQAAIRAAAAAN